ncbi:hypothetical protein BDB01DRAFT_850535 [Pilobolus umbonatus]|nr:hypothetical protein BDB01DRAFT_850535 [Pilobolus umbonatus]
MTSTLLQLPFELQLLILENIKSDSHLDLAPLAQACKYYSSLVSDRFNWNKTVTILHEKVDRSHGYLIHALNKTRHVKSFQTRQLQSMTHPSSIGLLFSILEKQHSPSNLEDIKIYAPANCHIKLYDNLAYYPQTSLFHLSIRDSMNDGYIMSSESYHMRLLQFLERCLSQSQQTLITLDLPSFPLNLLITHCNDYCFPQVKTLNIGLVGCQEPEYISRFWSVLKAMFPHLKELTLTLDEHHIVLFKSLLSNTSLFPWIKTLSVQDAESPKKYLSKDELRSSLLQLNGLSRITAGWDMIAL